MGEFQVCRRRLTISLVVSVGCHTITSTGALPLPGMGASTLVVQTNGPANTDGAASRSTLEPKNDRSRTGRISSKRKLRTTAKRGQPYV